MPQLAFVHQLIPPSVYGGKTAFPALSKIHEGLQRRGDTNAAVRILKPSKLALYAQLLERFPPPVAQALTLKCLNICLARYHFHARSAAVLSRPFGLAVDPSNMCQLACPGCVHSARSEELKLFDWHKGTLPEDRFAALLKLYGPFAIGVYFCNYGEPLLNLATPNLIRLAKQYLMRTALSTSLSIQRFDPDAYVESGLDYMVLSIDGATQSVYERFRRNGNLELVFSNVRKLVDAKRSLGKRTPVLCWNFLAFEHNAHEIPIARRMARQLGVNQFRVANPFDVRWDDPEMRPAAVRSGIQRFNWDLSGARFDEEHPLAENLDTETITRAFENAWEEGATDCALPTAGHTCHWLYKNMVMDATGRILPCCGSPRPDANLEFARFDATGPNDPFNSQKYRQARSFFAGGAPGASDAPYCEKCDWDQTKVNIGGADIRRYFRTADAAFFDRRSLHILSGW